MRESLIDDKKAEYDNRKYQIPFNVIYGGLKAGKSLSKIGKENGVSREYMSQLYNKHFKTLFPYRSARERSRKISHTAKIQKFYKENPLIARVIKKCLENNIDAQLIPINSGYKKNRLMIQGKLCAVLGTAKANKFSNQTGTSQYTRLQCSADATRNSQYIIGYQQETDLFFIYPTKELKQSYSVKNGIMMVYLPIRFTSYKRKPSHIDHKQYIENWEQLKKPL